MSTRPNLLWLMGFVFGCGGVVESHVAPPSGASQIVAQRNLLPIRKVRIYEAGFAQFERTSNVTSGSIRLRLPQAYLDDALKSLNVYSNGVRVPFVADFPSILPEERARGLAALPVSLENGLEFVDLVRSLTGELVEVAVGSRRVRGRLVRCDPLNPEPVDDSASTTNGKPPAPPVELKPYELTIVTDTTGIERFRSNDVRWLRPVAPELANQLDVAVRSSAQRHDKGLRELRIEPSARANLRLTYVSEAPIFRPLYRLDLEPGKTSTSLAGQALVHNNGSEDWNSVELTLTNDESDSFVVPLAVPRFWERRLKVTAQGRADPVPPSSQFTADRLAELMPEKQPPPSHDREQLVESPVRNQQTRAATRPLVPRNKPVGLAAGRGRYAHTIATPMTIRAGTSAVVPMPNTTVYVESGVWFTPRVGPGRNAVRIKNSAATAIPAGLLSVYASGQFCGEFELPQLEAERSGYFDYGTALGLEIAETALGPTTSKPLTVTWKDDTLQVRTAERQQRTVRLINRTDESKTAFIALGTFEHAVVQGGDHAEVLSDASSVVVTIVVPAHRDETRNLVVEFESEQAQDLDNMELTTIETLLNEAWGTKAARTTLREAKRLLTERQALRLRKDTVEQEVMQLEEASQRLNVADAANLMATNPMAARFIQLEVRRDRLKGEVTRLEQTLERSNTALKACLSKLTH